MINSKRKTVLMKAVSQLKQADYSREPELGSMYDRLSNGRRQFAEVFDKNINAVMQISSLDLTMNYQTQKIVDISNKISKATETIFGATSGSTNNPQEELTNTIIQISGKTDEVYKKIEDGQNELTAIKDLSSQTIHAAGEMQTDMDELMDIINHISSILSGIDTISLQTNLLALNASVEAARAGEAGKGFAVVASEIGSLADNSARAAEGIQRVSQEVIHAVNELAGESEQMIHFMNETAMAGYERLLDNSLNYKNDVGRLSETMNDFADESMHLNSNIDSIKEAVDTVNIAVEESAKGIVGVTEMASEMTTSMENIKGEAESNREIAGQLETEVGKFKL